MKYTHPSHIKRMLHNHGWENTTNSVTKRGQAGKETHQKKSFRGSKGPFQIFKFLKGPLQRYL